MKKLLMKLFCVIFGHSYKEKGYDIENNSLTYECKNCKKKEIIEQCSAFYE